jgi:hypothetical protein
LFLSRRDFRAAVSAAVFGKDDAAAKVHEAGFDLLCRADFRNFSEEREFLKSKLKIRIDKLLFLANYGLEMKTAER